MAFEANSHHPEYGSLTADPSSPPHETMNENMNMRAGGIMTDRGRREEGSGGLPWRGGEKEG